MDIKYFRVVNKHVQVLSIINSFDRQIVSTYIGTSCKSTDVINTLYQALKYRKTNGAGWIIRTDNGTQSISKLTSNFMETLGITQEVVYPHNPDCRTFIESFHASVQREFVALSEFTKITDLTFKRVIAFEKKNSFLGLIKLYYHDRFGFWPAIQK